MMRLVFNALGINCDRIVNGRPQGQFSDLELQIIDACLALPQDESQFIEIDLESDASALAIKGLVTDSHWSSLKAAQCDMVRKLRAACYPVESDPLLMEAEYDDSIAKRQAWRAKVLEIKDRYPFPGEYR